MSMHIDHKALQSKGLVIGYQDLYITFPDLPADDLGHEWIAQNTA